MPIRKCLEGTAFDADEVAAITAAFDSVCQELGYQTDRTPSLK